MNCRFRSHRFASTLLALLLVPGCVSTVRTSALSVTTPPPATPRAITIEVEAPMPDPLQDRHTLRVALEEAFTRLGYRVDGGDLVLAATITRVERHGDIANRLVGLGVHSDEMDVRVVARDANGPGYMTFVVRGKVLDKRYADMYGVTRDMAEKIASEVRKASR